MKTKIQKTLPKFIGIFLISCILINCSLVETDPPPFLHCNVQDNNCIDINYDGNGESIEENDQLPPGNSELTDTNGDGIPDKIILGTKGNVTLSEDTDIEDEGEKEIIMLDSGRPPGNFISIDLDNDKDPDIIIIGTGPTGIRSSNIDMDGDCDPEIVIEDPTRPPESSYTVDLDGDERPDVIVLGTSGAAIRIENIDDQPDDKEKEIVVFDPTRPKGYCNPVSLDDDNLDGHIDTKDDPDIFVKGQQ